MLAGDLKNLVVAAENKIKLAPVDFDVSFAPRLEHGDYATNAALVLGKELGRPPVDVAEQLVAVLNQEKPDYLERVEVAGGFVNFFLSKKFLAENLRQILAQGEKYGRGTTLAGKKVMVEYTDPNPFKEFHIGHLMSNAIGEATSRLIGWQGAEVRRVCYQGDVGLHVAKAIWELQNAKIVFISDIGQAARAYAAGSKLYDISSSVRREIDEINKKIYEQSDEAINKIYGEGLRVSREKFEQIYRRLGTKFDFYFFESESGPVGKKIVEENLGEVFEKSDGAVIFRGEKQGLHTRVFLTKDSLPTYETKELGLAKMKQEKWPHDLSVVVTGNEVNEYFKVVLKAMEQVLPDETQKIQHISHGMLRLPNGKMSSRKGGVITAEKLIKDVKELVREKTKEESVIEAVAIAAIKYSILKQSSGRDVIFDFDKSISFEGDSGPYLQYSLVRAKSVLEKAGKKLTPPKEFTEPAEFTPPWRGELLRLLPRFAEVTARAAALYAPHQLTSYLVELAGAFNTYYAKQQIIGSSEEDFRLALTAATAQVLENGFKLLALPVPDKM